MEEDRFGVHVPRTIKLRRWGLALACLLLSGCVLPTRPASTMPAGEVEMKRTTRRLERLDFGAADLRSSDGQWLQAVVLDVWVHDPGAEHIRHDVVAQALPKIAAELGAAGDEEAVYMVRLMVVPGSDLHEAWLTELKPRQVRAMAKMEPADRAALLARLPWGYTQRRKDR